MSNPLTAREDLEFCNQFLVLGGPDLCSKAGCNTLLWVKCSAGCGRNTALVTAGSVQGAWEITEDKSHPVTSIELHSVVLGQRTGSQCSHSGGAVGVMTGPVDQRTGLKPLAYYRGDHECVKSHSLPWVFFLHLANLRWNRTTNLTKSFFHSIFYE